MMGRSFGESGSRIHSRALDKSRGRLGDILSSSSCQMRMESELDYLLRDLR